ncbi:4'-phosphopantetheinyl transferase family protein [Streptomyces sp. NPDC002324]
MIKTSTDSASQCHVWWTETSGAARTLQHLLSDAERFRATSMIRPADQDRFVAGRALLRIVAGDLTGRQAHEVAVGSSCPDCSRPHGKPTLPGTEWEASISHSGRLAAVAVCSAGPVGLDIEHIDAGFDVAELEPQALSLVEREAFGPRTPEAFFRTWTRKEAIVKATGDGLRIPLPRLSVSAPYKAPAVMDFADRPDLVGRIQLTDLEGVPGYAAALAVIAQEPVRYTEHHLVPPTLCAV